MATIQISDFAREGVTLTPATASDFDERAQDILDGDAAPLLQLKPYLTIVSNRNPRTVVAYSVAWTVTQRNDASVINYGQFKFPDAVAGTGAGLSVLQDREIRTGDDRLIGMGFEAWPPEYAERYRDFGLEQVRRLSEVKALRIALDAVVFDDGEILGPDNSRLAEHFIEYVHAKQTLFRDIVIGLENGDTVAEAFGRVNATLAAKPSLSNTDPYAIYPRLAAQDVARLHRRVVTEVFRRTLRREPFAIRRPSETSD